jgi:hypothetical protein
MAETIALTKASGAGPNAIVVSGLFQVQICRLGKQTFNLKVNFAEKEQKFFFAECLFELFSKNELFLKNFFQKFACRI